MMKKRTQKNQVNSQRNPYPINNSKQNSVHNSRRTSFVQTLIAEYRNQTQRLLSKKNTNPNLKEDSLRIKNSSCIKKNSTIFNESIGLDFTLKQMNGLQNYKSVQIKRSVVGNNSLKSNIKHQGYKIQRDDLSKKHMNQYSMNKKDSNKMGKTNSAEMSRRNSIIDCNKKQFLNKKSKQQQNNSIVDYESKFLKTILLNRNSDGFSQKYDEYQSSHSNNKNQINKRGKKLNYNQKSLQNSMMVQVSRQQLRIKEIEQACIRLEQFSQQRFEQSLYYVIQNKNQRSLDTLLSIKKKIKQFKQRNSELINVSLQQNKSNKQKDDLMTFSPMTNKCQFINRNDERIAKVNKGIKLIQYNILCIYSLNIYKISNPSNKLNNDNNKQKQSSRQLNECMQKVNKSYNNLKSLQTEQTKQGYYQQSKQFQCMNCWIRLLNVVEVLNELIRQVEKSLYKSVVQESRQIQRQRELKLKLDLLVQQLKTVDKYVIMPKIIEIINKFMVVVIKSNNKGCQQQDITLRQQVNQLFRLIQQTLLNEIYKQYNNTTQHPNKGQMLIQVIKSIVLQILYQKLIDVLQQLTLKEIKQTKQIKDNQFPSNIYKKYLQSQNHQCRFSFDQSNNNKVNPSDHHYLYKGQERYHVYHNYHLQRIQMYTQNVIIMKLLIMLPRQEVLMKLNDVQSIQQSKQQYINQLDQYLNRFIQQIHSLSKRYNRITNKSIISREQTQSIISREQTQSIISREQTQQVGQEYQLFLQQGQIHEQNKQNTFNIITFTKYNKLYIMYVQLIDDIQSLYNQSYQQQQSALTSSQSIQINQNFKAKLLFNKIMFIEQLKDYLKNSCLYQSQHVFEQNQECLYHRRISADIVNKLVEEAVQWCDCQLIKGYYRIAELSSLYRLVLQSAIKHNRIIKKNNTIVKKKTFQNYNLSIKHKNISIQSNNSHYLNSWDQFRKLYFIQNELICSYISWRILNLQSQLNFLHQDSYQNYQQKQKILSHCLSQQHIKSFSVILLYQTLNKVKNFTPLQSPLRESIKFIFNDLFQTTTLTDSTQSHSINQMKRSIQINLMIEILKRSHQLNQLQTNNRNQINTYNDDNQDEDCYNQQQQISRRGYPEEEQQQLQQDYQPLFSRDHPHGWKNININKNKQLQISNKTTFGQASIYKDQISQRKFNSHINKILKQRLQTSQLSREFIYKSLKSQFKNQCKQNNLKLKPKQNKNKITNKYKEILINLKQQFEIVSQLQR